MRCKMELVFAEESKKDQGEVELYPVIQLEQSLKKLNIIKTLSKQDWKLFSSKKRLNFD